MMRLNPLGIVLIASGLLLLAIGFFRSPSDIDEEEAHPVVVMLIGLACVGGGVAAFQADARTARDKRRRARRRAARVDPFLLEANDLTPSELVLIHGALFAGAGDCELLDEATTVDTRELFQSCVEVAIDDLISKGAIRLSAGGGRVVMRPRGDAAAEDWPRDTLENRLCPTASLDLEAAISKWLRTDADAPLSLAVDKLKVLATLRGIAGVHPSRTARYAVGAVSADVFSVSRSRAESLGRRLEALRAKKPEFSKVIRTAIDRATAARTDDSDRASQPDPWEFESVEVRRQLIREFAPSRGPSSGRGIQVAGLFLWGLLTVAISVLPVVMKIVMAIAATSATIAIVTGWRGWLRSDALDRSRDDVRRFGLWVEAPLAGLLFAPVVMCDLFFFVPALWIASAQWKRWQEKTRRAIGEVVTAPTQDAGPEAPEDAEPEDEAPAPDEPVGDRERSDPWESESAPRIGSESSFAAPVELVTSDDFHGETASRDIELIEGLEARTAELRAGHTRLVRALAISSVVLAVICTFLGAGHGIRVEEAGGMRDSVLWPCFSVLLLVITHTALSSRRFAETREKISRVREIRDFVTGDDRRRARRNRAMKVGRSTGLAIVGDVWVAVTLSRIWFVNDARSPGGIVLVVGSILLIGGYLYMFHETSRRVRRRHPDCVPPRRLLALRTFGTPSLDDYSHLTDQWRWLGPLNRIDGPDTAGSKFTDVMSFLGGRVEDAIVEDSRELEAAVRGFEREHPDHGLRYPLHSVQCNDACWQEALNYFIDRADVVAMDLCHFTTDRSGCVFEIRHLIDEVPLSRVIFLVDEQTDMDGLRTIFEEAWKARPPSSPNRDASDVIRLVEVGGPSGLRPDEAEIDWERRHRRRLDDRTFLALVKRAAQDSRPYRESEPRPTSDWAEPYREKPTRTRTIAFAVATLLTVLAVWL